MVVIYFLRNIYLEKNTYLYVQFLFYNKKQGNIMKIVYDEVRLYQSHHFLLSLIQ